MIEIEVVAEFPLTYFRISVQGVLTEIVLCCVYLRHVCIYCFV